MLSSFIANIFGGSKKDLREDAVEHTATDEEGEWLLITTKQTSIGSWVITPAPAFHCTSLSPPLSSETSNPLEDMLIEHPTMSVYCGQHPPGNINQPPSDAHSESTNDLIQSEPNLNDWREDEIRLRNQNERERALRQNRQRQQLATHMQIPLQVQDRSSPRRLPPAGIYGVKPSQLTRRALRRQNTNGLRHRGGGGKLHQGNRLQKCTFKAGRRRC